MNIIEFVVSNPIVALLALIVICSFALFIVALPFDFALKCWNRHLRRKNIAAHGWPPVHCDADGDAIEPGDYKWESCDAWMNDFRVRAGGFSLDPHAAARLAFDAARETV